MVEPLKELTETIINERTKEFSDMMDNLLEWKRHNTKRVEQIEQELKDLSKDVEDVTISFITKEEEYDIKKLELKKKTL